MADREIGALTSLHGELKAAFPRGPVSAESAKQFGDALERMKEWDRNRPPEPEAARVARERLDALTGRPAGKWTNLWSSMDEAGSLRDRLETDLAHRPPPTPAERLAVLDRLRVLNEAIGRGWQTADALGWRHPDATEGA